ncbi:MAG: integrase arm-type DNA-binding domain-containing protein, partial [Desulfobulbus sp.]|nr:integrase arm-type DNA-binding domain-containing protein [Desulfobulbus sp.]
MESHFSFTSNKLKNLSPKTKRYLVYDTKQPGLRLYVTPTGIKTFQFQVRSKQLDRVVTRTLGKFPSLKVEEARNQAAALLKDVNSGVDIEAIKRDDRRQRLLAPTVSDFADEYLEKYAKLKKKTWQADQRILEMYVLPVIGRTKMKEV